MTKQAAKVVGQTKDVGFQIGVRRTFDVTLQQAWSALTSEQGLRLWLGDVPEFRLEPGTSYLTREGIRGEIRVVKPGGHVRMAWQPGDWPNESTLQVRVIPGSTSGRTAVSFHQEKLRDARQRRQMHRHWLQVLDQLDALFQSEE